MLYVDHYKSARPHSFTSTLLVMLGVLISSVLSTALHAKTLALTFDDGFDIATAGPQAIDDNMAMLRALEAHGVRSIIFPSGTALASPDNLALVRQWGDQGHAIGNHTYSHETLSESDTTTYLNDIVRAQNILETLPGWCPRLRFPYLDEGKRPQQHNDVMAWLGLNGYGVVPATITLPDWDYSERYLNILKTGTPDLANEFLQAYINDVLEEANNQDDHWRNEIERSPDHILLLHTNHLNATVLPELLNAFKKRGWTFTNAAQALNDPIYLRTFTSGDPHPSVTTVVPAPPC